MEQLIPCSSPCTTEVIDCVSTRFKGRKIINILHIIYWIGKEKKSDISQIWCLYFLTWLLVALNEKLDLCKNIFVCVEFKYAFFKPLHVTNILEKQRSLKNVWHCHKNTLQNKVKCNSKLRSATLCPLSIVVFYIMIIILSLLMGDKIIF